MIGYKFRDDIKRDIDDSLAMNKLFAPNKDNLNDPTEMHFDDSEFTDFLNNHKEHCKETKKCYEHLLDFTRNTCGVFSLSKNVDNELLWAYYANGHKGFCIEYDIDIIMESYNYEINSKIESLPLVHRIEVKYQSNFPLLTTEIINRQKKDLTEGLTCTIGTKSINWEKENEIRLIFNKHGFTELDYRAIKGIYFGCRFNNSSNEIKRIMNLLGGRNIKYYQMKFIKNSYKLDFDKLKDEYYNAPKYIVNNLPYNNIPCHSVPSIEIPNKDLLEKALKIVSKEPCIYKIKCSHIFLKPTPLIVIETYTNKDFGIYPIKYFRFDINFSDRTIHLRRFQKLIK